MTEHHSDTSHPPLLVGVRETARLLSVCPRTVQTYIALRELPARKIGRRTLIPYSAVVAFARRDHATAPDEVAE